VHFAKQWSRILGTSGPSCRHCDKLTAPQTVGAMPFMLSDEEFARIRAMGIHIEAAHLIQHCLRAAGLTQFMASLFCCTECCGIL
jgi:hypothetical protein